MILYVQIFFFSASIIFFCSFVLFLTDLLMEIAKMMTTATAATVDSHYYDEKDTMLTDCHRQHRFTLCGYCSVVHCYRSFDQTKRASDWKSCSEKNDSREKKKE